MPGFTGIVNGWQHVTCSLAPYAGQTIALQFRSWNDPLTFGADETKPAGFWVDNITVGSQVFDGSSMAGWQSMTEFHPTPVAGFVVTIMGVDGKKITLKQLKLNDGLRFEAQGEVQKYVQEGRPRRGDHHVRRSVGDGGQVRAVPADGQRRRAARRRLSTADEARRGRGHAAPPHLLHLRESGPGWNRTTARSFEGCRSIR